MPTVIRWLTLLLVIAALLPAGAQAQTTTTPPTLQTLTSMQNQYVLVFNERPILTCQSIYESYWRIQEVCLELADTPDGVFQAGRTTEYIEYDGTLFIREDDNTTWESFVIFEEEVDPSITLDQRLFNWIIPGTPEYDVPHALSDLGRTTLDETPVTHYQVWVTDPAFNASRGGQVTYDAFVTDDGFVVKDQFNVRGTFEGLGEGTLANIWVNRDLNTPQTVTPPPADSVVPGIDETSTPPSDGLITPRRPVGTPGDTARQPNDSSNADARRPVATPERNTRTAAAQDGADAAPQQSAKVQAPSIRVEVLNSPVNPNDVVRIKTTVDNNQNRDNRDLNRVEVTIPYSSSIMTLDGRKLRSDKDWIREITGSRVVIQFGTIRAGSSRSATLEFTVNPGVPDSTVYENRARYRWSTSTANNDGRTGTYRIVVFDPNIPAQATITPQVAPAGTEFTITANRFGSNEQVITWLNMPNGTAQPLPLAGNADAAGNIRLEYNSSRGMAPGTYSIVLNGNGSSGRQYVVPFTIQ